MTGSPILPASMLILCRLQGPSLSLSYIPLINFASMEKIQGHNFSGEKKLKIQI